MKLKREKSIPDSNNKIKRFCLTYRLRLPTGSRVYEHLNLDGKANIVLEPDATWWGNNRENYVRQGISQRFNWKLEARFEKVYLDRVSSHPDAYITNYRPFGKDFETTACLEIKCPYSGILYDGVKLRDFIQCQMHMCSQDLAYCVLVDWTPEGCNLYEISRCDETYQHVLLRLKESSSRDKAGHYTDIFTKQLFANTIKMQTIIKDDTALFVLD